MTSLRTLAVAVAVVLSAHTLQGQDRARYREFPLGGDLASISALAGVAASEARTIHAHPVMMQELQWQRPYSVSGAAPTQPDPVQQIVFSFYNDQLSKMVIDYDRDRTAGLTDADLIDAISVQYGAPLKRGAKTGRAVTSQVEDESGTLVARWSGTDYSVGLYKASYASGFRLIVSSPRLDALARTADGQGTRLEERDAPRREILRQKKEAADLRTAQAKARLTNKAAFRP